MISGLLALPSHVQGQQGSIHGRVRASEFGNALAGVAVSLRGTEQVVVTNQEGRFILPRLKDGIYWLEFRMLGYAPHADSVRLEDGQSVFIDLALSTSPVQLEALKVVARSGPTAAWLASRGFPQRGTDSLSLLHLTNRDIARQGVRNLNDVLRRVKTLQMRRQVDGGSEFFIAPSPLPNGEPCRVAVYLNGHLIEFGQFNWTGVRMYQRASRAMRVDDLLRLEQVDGVELYGPADSPVASDGACGALLLWSSELRPSVDTPFSGTIRGSAVLESTGNVMSGVRVRISALGLEVVTDDSGRFEIPDILPGEYEVQASYPGVETWRARVEVKAFGIVELVLHLGETNARL